MQFVPECGGDGEGGVEAAEDGAEEEQLPHPDVHGQTGGNCIKVGLPGKLILSKRKGLWEDLFS